MRSFLRCINIIPCFWLHSPACILGFLQRQYSRHQSDIYPGQNSPSDKYASTPNLLSDNLRYGNKKGFTLIEVMMVIAILGTLAAIAIPNYLSYIERSHYTATIQTMRIIEKQIIIYNLENGRFPNTLAEAGLDLLRDRWGNPFGYLNIADSPNNGMRRKNRNLVPINEDFDLYSMGPDGKSTAPLTARDSRDDIVRANNGAFLGKASNY